jgi:hypothetical protein
MLSRREAIGLRGCNQAMRYLMEAVRSRFVAGDLQEAAAIVRYSHELSTAVVILLGGSPANNAAPNETAPLKQATAGKVEDKPWPQLRRDEAVTVARWYADRVFKTHIASGFKDQWTTLAEDTLRHEFFTGGVEKLAFTTPWQDVGFTVPTMVAQHGDLKRFLNRCLFGMKYLREDLVERKLKVGALGAAEAVSNFINIVKATHHMFDLLVVTEDTEQEMDGFKRALTIQKLLWRDVSEFFFAYEPSKDRDAWRHYGFAGAESQKFPNSQKDPLDWEHVEE